MFLIDRIILIGAVLLLIGIVSSKFSSRLGLPVLVLFLLVGMLAGSERIGGIEFDDALIAHAVGTVGLATSVITAWPQPGSWSCHCSRVSCWEASSDLRMRRPFSRSCATQLPLALAAAALSAITATGVALVIV